MISKKIMGLLAILVTFALLAPACGGDDDSDSDDGGVGE